MNCPHCGHPTLTAKTPQGVELVLDDRRIAYEVSDAQEEPTALPAVNVFVLHHLICRGSAVLPFESFPLAKRRR